MNSRLSRRPAGSRPWSARRTRRSPIASRGIEMEERLETLEATVAAMVDAQAAQTASLAEALERLDKQLARAGREQFKANTLGEAQQKNVETALEQLRDSTIYREKENAQLRESLTEAHDAGRMDIVRRLLPALDGLEEALASGKRMQRAATETPTVPPRSFWQRLIPQTKVVPPEEMSSQKAIDAWLEGLTFVRDRFLETLASINVKPILTEGHDFDPHQHVVVETAPATEAIRPGTIVREHRRGFIHGDTVLRYAEVVVAQAPTERHL